MTVVMMVAGITISGTSFSDSKYKSMSKSDAWSKCSSSLKRNVDSGKYISIIEKSGDAAAGRAMDRELESCMSRYGY